MGESNGYSLFRTTQTVIFGSGSLETLPDQVKFLGGRKAFIATDPGIEKAGILGQAEQLLSGAGIEFESYTKVEPEPPTTSIDACADAIARSGAEVVIGLGGGSSMDTSQIAACGVTNGLKAEQMLGIEAVPKPGLQTISVPTTAGTASEVTGNAVAVLPDRSNKMAVVSPYIYPQVAIVDPLLTHGVPANVTAYTGVDAFCHAAESFISNKATPHTQLYARESMSLILGNLADAYADGSNAAARSAMARASLMAGYTLANAGTTMVHAMAHVLGARARVPHGLANAIFLLPVMRFYANRAPEQINRLAGAVGVSDSVTDQQARADQAVGIMEKMVNDVEIDRKLGNYGVKEEDLQGIAETTVATRRLMLQSPVDATVQDVLGMLQGIY